MTYSPVTMDHFNNPRNVGVLDSPTVIGQHGTAGQGNFMTIHVRVADGRIADIRYQTYGCPAAIACGSMATELAKGAAIAEAAAICAQQVVEALGGLPLGKRHCASLAVAALHDALAACT